MNEQATDTRFQLEDRAVLSKNINETPSNPSTPTSMLSDRFLLKSPFGFEIDDNESPTHRVFSLDSPVTASRTPDHNSPGSSVGTPRGNQDLNLSIGASDHLGKAYDGTISDHSPFEDQERNVLSHNFISRNVDDENAFWKVSPLKGETICCSTWCGLRDTDFVPKNNNNN